MYLPPHTCGHTWCEDCARQDLAARELQAARDRAHRPGAAFATNADPGSHVYQNPEILHTASCVYVIHPDVVTLGEYTQGREPSWFFTGPEAVAWLLASRQRRPCRACHPGLPTLTWPPRRRPPARSRLGWPADTWHQPTTHHRNNTCV